MPWLREKEVNILEYLPEFLPSDKEFKNLSDTLSKEHETIREDLHYLLAEVIITTDSSYGLSLWEAALELSPAAGATDEERRRDIMLHLQAKNVSTIRFMTALAKRYCTPETSVKIEEHNEEYSFDVTMEGELLDRAGLRKAIELYKPAHLDCSIKEIVALIEYLKMRSSYQLEVGTDKSERYRWIGRRFDGAYAFGGSACKCFDGSTLFDGANCFDGGIEKKTEDRQPILFDGIITADGTYKFVPWGRDSPPMILFDSPEPDVLHVDSAVPELSETYRALYQFDGALIADGSRKFGYNEGPQEAADLSNVVPCIGEKEKTSESIEQSVAPNVSEVYPFHRTRYFDGSYAFDKMNLFDGSEWFGGEWHFDGAHEAKSLPTASMRFDGSATFVGKRTFSANLLEGGRFDAGTSDELDENVRTEDAESVNLKETSSIEDTAVISEHYAKNVFDGSRKADGGITFDTTYKEMAGATADASLSDTITHRETFDGGVLADGKAVFGTNRGPMERFGAEMLVGRCFDGSIQFDGNGLRFDKSIKFDGAKTFALLHAGGRQYDGTMKANGVYRFGRDCERFEQHRITL